MIQVSFLNTFRGQLRLHLPFETTSAYRFVEICIVQVNVSLCLFICFDIIPHYNMCNSLLIKSENKTI